MNRSRPDGEASIFTAAEAERLYEDFSIRLSQSPFETEQQKHAFVKVELEILKAVVKSKMRRKELGIYLVCSTSGKTNEA